MGPIFIEKVAEKWNLWVHKQYTMCIDGLKNKKVKLCGYCVIEQYMNSSRSLTNACKKKKKEKRKRQTPNAQSKLSLNNLKL